MIPIFTSKYWAERGARMRVEEFCKGWNFAAGNLLRGAPVEELRNWPEQSRTFDHETAFDEGMDAAMDVWEKHISAPGLPTHEGEPL